MHEKVGRRMTVRPEDHPRLAAVMPALNAAGDIAMALRAIAASTRRPDSILVYDDGSSDATGSIAASLGAEVIRNDGLPRGPAHGRNICAQKADAEILLFVDADVVVAPDAIGRLEGAILAAEDVGAAFGSYDDAPASRRLPSLYSNLRHHFVHQQGAGAVSTFWAGLGAVRRDVFLQAGGYDSGSYAAPSIEDIELGARIRACGFRILLDPCAQGKHLKDWRLLQLWKTDISRRAIPWARLIASGAAVGTQLNASPTERLRALAAHIVWLCAAAGAISVLPFASALVALLLYAALNAPFLRLLWRRGGLRLAVAGVFLHWLYHIYASVIFGAFLLQARLGAVLGRPGRERRT